MFRIVLNALWSKDYVAALIRLLSETLACTAEEAKRIVDSVAEGNPKDILCTSPGQAYDLATDLLQYGVFIQVEQTGQVSDTALADDTCRLIHEDMQSWLVVYDAEGNVQRMVESNTLGYLTFERENVSMLVGKEMIARGAQAVGQAEMDAIQARVDAARAERISYAKMMTERHGPNWKRILYQMRNGLGPYAEPAREEE